MLRSAFHNDLFNKNKKNLTNLKARINGWQLRVSIFNALSKQHNDARGNVLSQNRTIDRTKICILITDYTFRKRIS